MDKKKKNDHILKIRNLVKIYSTRGEKITAIDNINFDVKRGEIFSLLGPNGAGKTTLVRIITTLESPTKGSVELDGYDIKKDPGEVRKLVGIVPQKKSLYEKLTAKETLEMMGALYGVPEEITKERIEDLLDLVNLEDRKDSLVKGFSGGMKQRLSLASGLIHHPKLLILDEPTTGLDPQTRRRLWNLIEDLNEEGVTIFINTHIMEEADTLSDRIGIMHKGKLMEIDTAKNLKRLIGGGDIIKVLIPTNSEKKSTEILRNHKLVQKIEKLEGGLKIATANRSKALYEIPQLLSKKKIDVRGVEVLEPTLEDVFIHVTGDN